MKYIKKDKIGNKFNIFKWIISYCTIPSKKRRQKLLNEYDKKLIQRFYY